MLRSLFFYTEDDDKHEFYNRIGIYPDSELLIEMISFSETWNGHVTAEDERFIFLKALKNLLREISNQVLPMALPSTENKRMLEILNYIEKNLLKRFAYREYLISLASANDHFPGSFNLH